MIFDDVLNNREQWTPNMRPPSEFDSAAYQKRINDVVGTRNDRPIIKLAWAPDELRWRPYRMNSGVEGGYTFPIFHCGHDTQGNDIAAPRWVLLERIEPEQFAPGWEATRYTVYDESVWDLKGPCPPERYTELKCHSEHDGCCCSCKGSECKCGEQYDHCWGFYLEPNERLLSWVKMVTTKVLNDADVNPTQDARFFEAPQGQRDAKSLIVNRQQQQDEDARKLNEHYLDFWNRKPVSVPLHGWGVKKNAAGLYVIDSHPVDAATQ